MHIDGTMLVGEFVVQVIPNRSGNWVVIELGGLDDIHNASIAVFRVRVGLHAALARPCVLVYPLSLVTYFVMSNASEPLAPSLTTTCHG